MKTATKTLILRYAAEPKTALQLAIMLGIAKQNVNQSLRQLIDADLVKIVGYAPNFPGRPSPLYCSNMERMAVPYAKRGRQAMGVVL